MATNSKKNLNQANKKVLAESNLSTSSRNCDHPFWCNDWATLRAMHEQKKRDFISNQRQRRANKNFVRALVGGSVACGQFVISGIFLAISIPIIGGIKLTGAVQNGTKAVGGAVIALPGQAIYQTGKGIGAVGKGVQNVGEFAVKGTAAGVGAVAGAALSGAATVVGGVAGAAYNGTAAVAKPVQKAGKQTAGKVGQLSMQANDQVWELQDALFVQYHHLAEKVGLEHGKVQLNSSRPKSFVAFNMDAFQSLVNSQLHSDIQDVFEIDSDQDKLSVEKESPPETCQHTSSRESNVDKLRERARKCMSAQLYNAIADTEMKSAALISFEQYQDKKFTIRSTQNDLENELCDGSHDCIAIDMKFPIKIEIETNRTIKLKKRQKFKNFFRKFGMFGGKKHKKFDKEEVSTFHAQNSEAAGAPEENLSQAQTVIVVSWTGGKMKIDMVDQIEYHFDINQVKVEVDGQQVEMPERSADLQNNLKDAVKQIISSIIKKTVNYTFSNELSKVKLFDKVFKNSEGQLKGGMPVLFDSMNTNSTTNFMTMLVNIDGQKSASQAPVDALAPVGNTLQFFINSSALMKVVDWLIESKSLMELIRHSVQHIVQLQRQTIDWNDLEILPLNQNGTNILDNHRSYIRFYESENQQTQDGKKTLNSGIGIELHLQTLSKQCLSSRPIQDWDKFLKTVQKIKSAVINGCVRFVFKLKFTLIALEQKLNPIIEDVQVYNHKDEGNLLKWTVNLWDNMTGHTKEIEQQSLEAVTPIAQWIVEKVGSDFEFFEHTFLQQSVDNIDGMMRIATSIEKTQSKDEIQEMVEEFDGTAE